MSAPGDLKIRSYDPLQRDLDLPLRTPCYPMGFQAEIATNSRDVLAAAQESWGCYRPLYHNPPVRVRVVVNPEGDLAPEPAFRGQGDLFGIVSDRDNFAFYDRNQMVGACFISERTAADHAWFRWHYLETIVYMLLAQRYVTPVHAASIARNGRGLLLCGASAAGKSTLAYYCARAGWTYLGDDAAWLVVGDGAGNDQPPSESGVWFIGRPHQVRFRDDAPSLFPELEEYTLRLRPNGKLSMEVPLSAFPHIRTEMRSRAHCLVLLDRKSGSEARAQEVRGAEVVDYLLRDVPSYGEEVAHMYERTARPLADLPAYRLTYQRLEDAERLLSELV